MRYQPDNLNYRPIYTASELQHLHQLAGKLSLAELLVTPRNLEAIGIEFIYSSAQLEGNGYSKADTLALFNMGQTAGGKQYSDAVMLLNLRRSYQYLLAQLGQPPDWLDFVKTTHSLIARDLVLPEEAGVVRRKHITITETDYIPLDNPQQLDAELKYLLHTATAIQDPFEQALYLHNNLAYLQYFIDCNKRTGRNSHNYALMNAGHFPCIYPQESYRDYISGLITYYESGDYRPSAIYHISAYEQTAARYGTQPDIDIVRPPKNQETQ